MINGPQRPGYPSPLNTRSYLGTSPNMSIMDRRPTSIDVTGYEIGWWWVVPVSDTFLTGEIWNLVSLDDNIATWKRLGGGAAAGVESLTGNTGGPVDPLDGNINVVGSGSVVVTGNPGTNTLTITTSGGGGGVVGINKIYLTSSGSYIKPSNLVQLQVECVGGGGGSAGDYTPTGNPISNGAGGGGGGYCSKFYLTSSLSSSEPYIVGSAGAAGVASGSNAGGTGGTTTFKALSATGGTGSQWFDGGGITGMVSAIGNGGTSSGGDINIDGQQGSWGFQLGGGSGLQNGGAGGSSVLGIGAPFVQYQASQVLGNIFGTPVGYGAGASGKSVINGGGTGGSAGTQGLIILTEYLS